MAEMKVSIGYNFDKAGLEEFKRQLTSVRLDAEIAKSAGKLTTELEKASEAATKLDNALDISYNRKLDQINLNKFQSELKKSGESVKSVMEALSKGSLSGQLAFEGLARKIATTNIQLKTSSKILDSFATTFKNTVRYGISSSVFNNLSNSIQKAYNYTKQLDTSLNDIRIVTGKSADEMDLFAIKANKAAKELGKSTRDFTEASLIYYQQGLGDTEAQARAAITLKAANVTGQSSQEVSELLTSVWNGYKVTADEAELYVDKLAAVAASTASDLEELSTGMSKVASAANLMGIDIDQLSAQMSTIISATRQAPESVGVALKTIYARMGDIKSGVDAETTLGNYTSKMAEMGINVLDANNNLRDMGEVIEEIGSKWQSMTREQQIALSQTMAGTRQYNNLLSLFDNWDKYTKALETSRDAAGTLQKQQDIYMESTEAHLRQLSTEAERTYDIIFNQKTVNAFADTFTNVLKQFNDYIKGIGGGMNALLNLGSQIAILYRKQIGDSILRQTENLKIWWDETFRGAKVIEKLKEDVNNVRSGSQKENLGAFGEVYSKEYKSNTDEVLETVEKAYQLRKGLTAEQFNEIQNEAEHLAQLKDEVAYYNIIKKRGQEEYGITDSVTAKNWIDVEMNNIKAMDDAWRNIKKINNEIIDLNEQSQKAIYTDEQAQLDEERAEKRKALQAELLVLENDELLSKEKQEEIESIRLSLKNNEVLTEEQLKTLSSTKLDLAVKHNNILLEYKAILESILRDENNITEEKKAQIQDSINKIDELLKNAGKRSKTATGVQIGSAIIQGLTAATGAISVFSNENATEMDKINAAWEGTWGIGSAIANAILPGSGFIVQGLSSITKSLLESSGLWDEWFNSSNKIEKIRKTVQELADQAKKAKEDINGLKDALDRYDEVEKTLKACTNGTYEWEEALKNVNTTILDILEKYPQLAKIENLITKDEITGQLKINTQLVEEYQKALEKQYISQKASSIIMSGYADQKQNEKDFNNLLNNINNQIAIKSYSDSGINMSRGSTYAWDPNNPNNSNKTDYFQWTKRENILTEENLKELAEIADVEFKYKQKVKEILSNTWLDNSQIESLSKDFEDLRKQLINFNKSTDGLTAEMENAAMMVASISLRSDATNVQKKFFAKEYSNVIEEERKKAQDLLKTDSAEAIKQYNEALGRDAYKASSKTNLGNKKITLYNKETGQDEEIGSREAFINTIASYKALSDAENKKTYERAEQLLKEVSKAGNISEEVADKILQRSFDINELTEKELENVKANKFRIAQVLTDQDFEDLGLSNWNSYVTSLEAAIDKWDSNESIRKAKERFNSSLEASSLQVESLFGLDSKDFKAYGQYLADLADTSDMLADTMDEDANATAAVTQSIMRMNIGIKDLVENWEEWNAVLNSGEKENEQYWQSLDKVQDALVELLNMNKDAKKYFSDDFIQKNADRITRASQGEANAVDELRKAFTDEVVLKIGVEQNLSTDAQNNLIGIINTLQAQIPDISIGYTINPGDNSYGSFLETCQNIIDQAKLTKDQANALFGAMGFQASYKTEEQPTQYEVPIYTTYTRDAGYSTIINGKEYNATETWTEQTGTKRLTGKYSTFGVAVTPEGETPQTPQISGMVRTANGSMGNYSPVTNKSGSGGGGSSKQPNKQDPIEKEKDRYHDINIVLKEIENQMNILEKEKDKLFGDKLIKNLNGQLVLLNKQIDATNEKIKIANGESAELKDKLSKSGVTFNADGTIANYAQVFESQLAYVNGIVNQYNSMGAEAQEGYKDTVDKAKSDFDKLIDDISRYDELLTDFIPGLQADIQDAIDKKIDLQVEKFDMEIELRLDMAEAQKQWNNFKKKVIDEIADDDILGNALARLNDFNIYYDESGNKSIQAQTRHLQDVLDEYNKQREKLDNIYGDNQQQALEDLKKYQETLMEGLEEVFDLEKEIHESYIQMMDEAQEKFDDHIDSYELVSEVLEHDMKLIQMTLGEDAYDKLSNYYNLQQDNYNKQVDFRRQELEFWREQMNILEENSDEWDNAKEKWEEALRNWQTDVEKALENIRAKFENEINLIFDNLNNQVTAGKGLEYINEEWTLINKNADQYLDTINAVTGIQDLNQKYLDAINGTSSAAQQAKLNKIREAEIKALKEKDKLTKYDLERAEKKYQVELALLALQEAQQNKSKMRLRRDSQGNYTYQYVADDDAVSDAEGKLRSAYQDLYNFDKETYLHNLEEMYSVWEEYQEKMAAAALINDPEERAEREALIQEEYGELINSLTEQNLTIRDNLYESAFDSLDYLYREDAANYKDLTLEKKDLILQELIPAWSSGVQAMTDMFAGPGGFEAVTGDAFDNIKQKTEEYENDMKQLGDTAGTSFDNIQNGLDINIDLTKELIQDNKELIDTYDEQLSKVRDVINELDKMSKKYRDIKQSALEAVEAANLLRNQEMEQAAQDAAEAQNQPLEDNTGINIPTSSSTPAETPTTGGNASTGGGDGVPQVGDWATYLGGGYYGDSYGGSGWGDRGPGGRVRITYLNPGAPYPIHVESSDSAYGWLRKDQLTGYDTGGYTGDWHNKDGRLALLHQKELVLNSNDTKNILDTVMIVRDIVDSLGSSIMTRLSGITAQMPNINGSIDHNQTLDQNVHIEANFPNVREANEIEQALNNLVNAASQRAMERR